MARLYIWLKVYCDLMSDLEACVGPGRLSGVARARRGKFRIGFVPPIPILSHPVPYSAGDLQELKVKCRASEGVGQDILILVPLRPILLFCCLVSHVFTDVGRHQAGCSMVCQGIEVAVWNIWSHNIEQSRGLASGKCHQDSQMRFPCVSSSLNSDLIDSRIALIKWAGVFEYSGPRRVYPPPSFSRKAEGISFERESPHVGERRTRVELVVLNPRTEAKTGVMLGWSAKEDTDEWDGVRDSLVSQGFSWVDVARLACGEQRGGQ